MRSLPCRGGFVAVCRVQRPACPGAKQSLGSGSASEVPENRNAAGWRPATCREIEPAQPRQAACRGGISSASGADCATRSLTTTRSRALSRLTCPAWSAASSSASDRAAQVSSARLMSSQSLTQGKGRLRCWEPEVLAKAVDVSAAWSAWRRGRPVETRASWRLDDSQAPRHPEEDGGRVVLA
jgi:hypothetical protein